MVEIETPKPAEISSNPQTQLTGAAGEAMAQVHLLMRGWIAGNINASVRNNAGFDLTATKGVRTVYIAVKAIGRGHKAQFRRPKKGKQDTLFAGGTYPDFVVFVWFIGKKEKPTEHRCFIVPTSVVDHDVLKADRHWFAHPRRDGEKRAETGTVSIGFLGNDTAGNIASNFAHKWKEYEDAWDMPEYSSSTSKKPM